MKKTIVKIFGVLSLFYIITLFLGCEGAIGTGPCNHLPPGCFHTTLSGSFGDPTRYFLLQIDDVDHIDMDEDEVCNIVGEIIVENVTSGEEELITTVLGEVETSELLDDRHEYRGTLQVLTSSDVWELYSFVVLDPTDARSVCMIELDSELIETTLPVPLVLTRRTDCPEDD